MNESAPPRFGLPKFDPRDYPQIDAQIDAQIDDELTFHIEQMTRELVADGQTEHDARVRALARFGNENKLKAQCKRIALGKRIMLQRINLVLMIIVLLAVAFVSVQVYITQKHNTLALQTIVSNIADMKTNAGTAPPVGKSHVVYIDGDIPRPGVYGIPANGHLTLPKLLLAAGLKYLPIDATITRTVEGNEETIINYSFATFADLARGIGLAPDDHVVVTTSDGL